MRMTEKQLQDHLNRHENKRQFALDQKKQKIDITLREKIKEANTEDLKRNTEVILSCEIGMIPPSVNHYWITSGKRRFLSDRARDFHDLVRFIVPAHQTKERLKLEVTFHFPDRQCRDIDNYLKATIDSLVKCGLCVDDEQFDVLVVKRGNIVKGGLIRLIVSELE
ncbi:RusA family crossover junction endodeoxyribonuclease [Acinetobacter sp. ANC 4640]